MLILADENIPRVREAFATLGEVRTLPGRSIVSGDLGDTGLLLVRSVTRVDRALLTGSKIRFVGSATAGVDHIDVAYLREAGIGFAHAPGANATSAAEYVIAALMALGEDKNLSLAGLCAGIIGCGNVGSRVAERLAALGVRCLLNDPPLAEKNRRHRFVDLQALAAADIVSAHVPLTTDGAHPTRHLLGEDFLSRLKPGAILVNTSRGGVLDERALKRVLEGRDDLHLVLDVWDHEPDIDLELLQRAAIATPHVAGYSLDGKLRGTESIYQAACRFFGRSPQADLQAYLSEPAVATLRPAPQASDEQILRQAVLQVYDPRTDDARLRPILSLPPARRGALFDELRKNYPPRREFQSMEVHLPAGYKTLSHCLRTLGFRVWQ